VRLEWTGDSIGGTETVKNEGAELVSSAQPGGMQMTTLVIPPREGKAVSLGGFGAIFKISGHSLTEHGNRMESRAEWRIRLVWEQI